MTQEDIKIANKLFKTWYTSHYITHRHAYKLQTFLEKVMPEEFKNTALDTLNKGDAHGNP